MFFVIIFLALAATLAYVFPEWSGAWVLAAAFAAVVTLRLLILVADRSRRPPPRGSS